MTTDLLDDLNEQYPARCLKPGELVEDHLRYAGKVELIQRLLREANPEK